MNYIMKGGLLNNVKLLYVVFVLSVINLLYYVYNKDNQSIFLFAVVALIVYVFNKNMIVVLLLTLFIVDLLILINSFNKEGLEDKKKDEKDKKKDDDKKDIPALKEINVEHFDSPKSKLKETKYPEDSENKNIKDLLGLPDGLDGLDINQINRMLNNFNNIIEKF